MDDDWAIVIGINQYPKVVGASPLQGAVDDARKFKAWLLKPEGGAVPQAHIGEFIQDASISSGTLKPTESQLRAFIEDQLLSFLPQRPFGRRLYLYFSGHGISPTGQESIRNAALLMANASMPTPLLHIPGNILAEGMRSSAYFKQVVLIMDCCRDFEKNVIPNHFDFVDPVDIAKSCVLVEAYATTWASKAREIPLPPDDRVQGVFTHALLEVLGAGQMSGMLLKQSVKRYLSRLLQDEKKAQDPVIQPDEELSKIIFNESAAPPRTPVKIKGHPAAQPVIEFFPPGSDTTQQVQLVDWTFDGSDWSGTLEPSAYELRMPGGGGKRFNIYAALPEEVQL
jgi:Caspase domain